MDEANMLAKRRKVQAQEESALLPMLGWIHPPNGANGEDDLGLRHQLHLHCPKSPFDGSVHGNGNVNGKKR